MAGVGASLAARDWPVAAGLGMQVANSAGRILSVLSSTDVLQAAAVQSGSETCSRMCEPQL